MILRIEILIQKLTCKNLLVNTHTHTHTHTYISTQHTVNGSYDRIYIP